HCAPRCYRMPVGLCGAPAQGFPRVRYDARPRAPRATAARRERRGVSRRGERAIEARLGVAATCDMMSSLLLSVNRNDVQWGAVGALTPLRLEGGVHSDAHATADRREQ